MKDLKITKGEWRIRADEHELYIDTHDREICKSWSNSIIAQNDMELIADAGNTAQKCGLLPSELLKQRDELREALAEQKRLYFNLFDEEVGCMYCEAKLKRGSAIILCKGCAENTEV